MVLSDYLLFNFLTYREKRIKGLWFPKLLPNGFLIELYPEPCIYIALYIIPFNFLELPNQPSNSLQSVRNTLISRRAVFPAYLRSNLLK